jgi:hypothetical protein
VYCCVRQALIEAIARVQQHGNEIRLVALKVI